jgi:hypothetical protein
MVHSLRFDVENPLGHVPERENLQYKFLISLRYFALTFHTSLTYCKDF